MKKLTITLMLSAGLAFLAGCGHSDSTLKEPTEPTLAEAIKSSKANELAGEEGAYIIFAQSRDGATMVNDVESLDTLYVLSAVGTDKTHVYETDKNINVLDDKLVDEPWMETEIYHPADLPNIDFDKAYSAVKAVAGDRPIANIAVFHTLEPENPLIVSYTLKGDTADSCVQYQYTVDTEEVHQTGAEVKCFFDMNPTETEELESEGFTGATFSFILKGLANGMLGKVGRNVMGDFLSLLGWGDSGNSDEEKTLGHIDSQLNLISSELNAIEGELQTILTDIKVSEDSIKNDVDWPRDAVTKIATATQDMQLLGEGVKPGEGDRTKIANLADDILGAQYDIPNQVMSIYTAIEGNPTPLFSNYVDKVMLQLAYNDDSNLQKAYQGFEYYTSELLNNQVKGVNLAVEAYKAKDDNASAQKYLDCYRSNPDNTSECNLLYTEIGDMDNKNSFIYNAVSMILKDAPLYGKFLPNSAESILKRAEFYRQLMTGTDPDDFEVRFFHISTADVPKTPDVMYARSAFDMQHYIPCPASRHTVTGRAYDYWDGDKVKSSTDYNVVEYNCGKAYNPKGDSYAISPCNNGLCEDWGNIEVKRYDTGYDLNSSGTIAYGFQVFTNGGRVDNHFTESSSLWSLSKDVSSHSSLSGGANNWPVELVIDNNDLVDDTINSKAEINGYFTYNGTEERQIKICYKAKYWLDASGKECETCPGFTNVAEAAYKTGSHNVTEGKAIMNWKYSISVEAGESKSGHYYPEHTMTFKVKPGYRYYIYFEFYVTANHKDDSAPFSRANLDEVEYVYFKFSGGDCE
ncbi:hypothetical protein [Sulfurovum sp. NBC37-1]|uniref:hypothetical protein n=1 Tax=Sulfurovum sp. (strain NBC37-1) TaxID=387093 RepID=UPI00015875A7|nr:hypothetical protein [Sulfurovum sp. NBC37-1]BAF71820.1 hypothetical protein SUN_0862 [Sulfurovum sp. NBC37-1]